MSSREISFGTPYYIRVLQILINCVRSNNSSNSTQKYGISDIRNSYFVANDITAVNGPIAGGLIYSYGLNSPLIITNSEFSSNTFTSTITDSQKYTSGSPVAKVYGTIAIDTGLNKGSNEQQTNVIILKAKSGEETTFYGNEIYEGSNPVRYNSLYFGQIATLEENSSYDGTYTYYEDYARSDAELIIQTEAGGTVSLYDPILVDQNNDGVLGAPNNRAFRMNVIGPGVFYWGGDNVIDTGAISGTNVLNEINLNYGSHTWLGAEMKLTAHNHTFHVYAGANLHVQNPAELTLLNANLHGTLIFNLGAGTVQINEPNAALLKITSTYPATVQGAVIKLMPFDNQPQLNYGDRFYLIDTGAQNQLKG
jgi:hypothetical protein